ncbi:MAG: hypothetical protein KKB81_05645 [Candidatus Margulisbacteria bacterium]|nr:hypothetical protein [Candidatus Margulisiibacteriota bacterium]MBU1021255.1 hypothetical protein [Candidatus Margulisiibacteriota bacterium]MBU1729256.1 hypothetical protein [Candidatus Margulisiibacteriota bacterium]MBU1954929.1 hypothetical protein [Candidatus Margulisiibacteriota bacterium]
MFLNIYSLPNFICFLFLVLLGCLVFIIKRDNINFAFMLLTLSAAIWQIGTFSTLCAKSAELAFFWTQFSYIGVTFIPITMLHFVMLFIKDKRSTKFIIGTYLIAAPLFIILTYMNIFLDGVNKFPWGYWFKATPFHPLYITAYSSLFFINLLLLYRAYLKNVGKEKERIKYLLLALLISYGGAIDYLAVYGINIYPIGFLFVIFCLVIISFAIIRHRLMDINVVIKKGLVYSTIIAIFTGAYLSAIYIITRLFENALGIGSLGIGAVLLFISALFFQPLKNKINQIIDKLFFKSSYEYHTALKNISKKVATAANLEDLNNLVSKEIKDTLKVKIAKIQMFK